MIEFILSDEISLLSMIIFILMLLATAWIGWFMYRAMKHPPKSIKIHREGDFDGIKEGAAATPFGMHVIFGLLLLFSIWYMAFGYPLEHDHSVEWYAEEVAEANQDINDRFANATEVELVGMGESVFNSKCAICHGLNGRGLNGIAANLVEFGSVDHIAYVIKNGSKGLKKLTAEMPPQYALLGQTDSERDENSINVAAYVMQLKGLVSTKGNAEEGKQYYDRVCVTCHGPDGRGGGPTGTIPNFAADLVGYGTQEYILDIVNNGKDGHIGLMPSFAETGLMSDIQLQAVSKYVEQELR